MPLQSSRAVKQKKFTLTSSASGRDLNGATAGASTIIVGITSVSPFWIRLIIHRLGNQILTDQVYVRTGIFTFPSSFLSTGSRYKLVHNFIVFV